MEWQSPTPYQILELRHHQKHEMVDVAASLRWASHIRPSSTSSQTLLVAPSNYDTFCRWSDGNSSLMWLIVDVRNAYSCTDVAFSCGTTKWFFQSVRFCMKLMFVLCTLLAPAHSIACSANTLSAISIGFGSLMNCISHFWVQCKTYCTGCCTIWKKEMSRIKLTIESKWYYDIHSSSSSFNHSRDWKVAPGSEMKSSAWSEHRQWIALYFLTTPMATETLQWKQPLMKW